MSDLDSGFLAFLQSDRVSGPTRDALLDRIAEPAGPRALSERELDVLRATIRRVIPQPLHAEIDLAARLDQLLAKGAGDGWRFAALPADTAAYRRGLQTLDAAGFLAATPAGQDALLERAATGGLMVTGGLAAAQMQHWFEDVRADAVKLYVAHPATMARIGYSGVGYGGDEPQGFHAVEPGQREPWEPLSRAVP